MGAKIAGALALLALTAVGQDSAQSPLDRILEAAWRDRGIRPAEPASDTEFLRRVNLDVIGVIPTVDETKGFLNDDRPDKRARKIESLVRSSAFATYWAEKLTNDWMGYGNIYFDNSRRAFKKWLKEQLLENRPYPEVAAAVVGAEISSDPGAFLRRWIVRDFTKASPEDAAMRVSRSFLGIQLHCAQCHDHPFDRWTRQDFYGVAAFFAGIKAENYYSKFDETPVRAYKVEGFKEPIAPKFPDGEAAPGGRPRAELAGWMSRKDNSYLARAICNRVWAYLFGRGIVEPWDDLNGQAKELVPGLLAALVEEFRAGGGDLRHLVRVIVGTRAYQRTSEKLGGGDGELFSRAMVRPMLPEQLLNSLMRATGVVPRGSDYNEFKGEFSRLFYSNVSMDRLSGADLTGYRGTIQQVLRMLDLDNDVYDGGRINGKGRLDALVEKHRSPEDLFEGIYLACLSRMPTEREREICLKHHKKWEEFLNAYEDVFWALLNSNEFFFNH
jgi:hypothetical protein